MAFGRQLRQSLKRLLYGDDPTPFNAILDSYKTAVATSEKLTLDTIKSQGDLFALDVECFEFMHALERKMINFMDMKKSADEKVSVSGHLYNKNEFLTAFISVKREINDTNAQYDLQTLLLFPATDDVTDDAITEFINEHSKYDARLLLSAPLVFCTNGEKVANFTYNYYKTRYYDGVDIKTKDGTDINAKLDKDLQDLIQHKKYYTNMFEDFSKYDKQHIPSYIINLLALYSNTPQWPTIAERFADIHVAFCFLSRIPEFNKAVNFGNFLTDYLWCLVKSFDPKQDVSITRTIVEECLSYLHQRFMNTHRYNDITVGDESKMFKSLNSKNSHISDLNIERIWDHTQWIKKQHILTGFKAFGRADAYDEEEEDKADEEEGEADDDSLLLNAIDNYTDMVTTYTTDMTSNEHHGGGSHHSVSVSVYNLILLAFQSFNKHKHSSSTSRAVSVSRGSRGTGRWLDTECRSRRAGAPSRL